MDEDAATDGHCERCGHRHAFVVNFDCTNCVYEVDHPVPMALLDAPELLAFVGEHGHNTTTDGLQWGLEYGHSGRGRSWWSR